MIRRVDDTVLKFSCADKISAIVGAIIIIIVVISSSFICYLEASQQETAA